jgi:predicted PurR-regulated permease PerM
MKVRIEIDNRTFIRFWLVVIGFAAVILMIWVARSAIVIIAMALFFALALNPPVSQLARRLPGKSRVGATALAYLIVIALLGGFFVLVVPPAIQETARFVQNVPHMIDEASKQRGGIESFLRHYNLDSQVNTAIENAKNQFSQTAQNIGNLLVGGVGVILSGLVTVILVLVLTFFMLVEGPAWMERVWGLYDDPDRLKHHKALISRMYRIVTGYVNGQILVAGIAATAALCVLLVLSAVFHLSLSLALPLAVIVFLCGMIPMIGSTLSAIIVPLVLLFSSFTAAIIFLVYFIIYQQIENNFIAPTIQARSVELSALAILCAILIGVSLFGLLGGVIAIPVAGCLRVLLIHYLEHARRERQEKSTPLHRLASKLKNDEA